MYVLFAACRIRARPVDGRPRGPSPVPGGSTSSSSGGGGQKVTFEPSVDFELDVKVMIDSGSCVLHPKEPKAESEMDIKK